MRFPFLSALLLAAFTCATAARAGTWSTTAWTGDATTHIVTGQTVWAYHFGSATPATVNSVSVPGIVGPTHASAEFDLTGTSAVFNGFTNNLTALGGPGSAVMAADFVYSGNPANITVKGLVVGQTYTVSFFGVDWANDPRLCTFTSGSDSLLVDEHQFGSANGIRVDYTFTAAAATRAFSIALANSNGQSWHLFGLALRQEAAPTTVTNVQDSGTGSLRWALANAAAIAGANTVTFDAALSGGDITTLSELTIADAGGVTIDASALTVPLTITGGGSPHRLITHTAGDLTLRRLRLVNGIADATAGVAPNLGGAVRSSGSAFAAFDCAFVSNQARLSGGALSLAANGASTIEGCTFSGNTTTTDAGPGSAGGAIASASALTLRKSTLVANSTFSGATGVSAGAIFNAAALTLEHCTITDNVSGGAGTRGAVYLSAAGGGSASITNTIVADNATTADVTNATGSAANLTYSGANIVRVATNALFTGPAPLTTAPLLGTFGANGGPTDTRAPQFGSPAIDAASVIAGHSTDQRGVARPFDGDGNGTATPDLGAVEARFPIVSNGNDSGVGSLRQAVADAATFAGPDTIVFRAASFPTGGTVNLTASLAIPAAGDPSNVTLAVHVPGQIVDVAVNAGTLSFGPGSTWTGNGKILLGATSGSAAATVEINDPNGGTTLAAPITVRAGSSGVKTLRDTNGDVFPPNAYSADVTLLAAATIEKSTDGALNLDGDVNLGPHLLTVNCGGAGQIHFTGRVFRDAGGGKAQLVKNGAGTLILTGNAENAFLALTVNAGTADLFKVNIDGVNAVGRFLTSGDGAALTVAAGATVNCNVGDQIANAARVVIDGTLILLSGDEGVGPLDGTGTIQAASGNRTLTVGDFGGSGSFGGTLGTGLALTKAGGGMQTLSGTSTATGALTVSGGILNVTGNVASTSGVTVQSFGTLAGTGTVPGVTIASGGTLAPGDATVPGSIGTLNTTGAATWNGQFQALFHLSAANNSSDRLALTGALTKGTAGSYAFDFQGTGLAGQTYTLATFASSTFVASDFIYSGLAPGLVGYFTKNATSLTFTVSAFSTIVASNADSGPGSLRQVIDDAAHQPGADTITFPPGFTGPIVLISGEILIAGGTGGVTIDATNLPGGLSLSANNGSRIFNVGSSNSLALLGLTLTGGSGSGGAIRNDTNGSLTLTRCTLFGNAATGDGGAIHNSGTATLTQCTLSGNSATAAGGAIYNAATVTLTQCTLAGNSAGVSGGAISNVGTLNLTNSISAGNSSPAGADLGNSLPVNNTGVNFLGNIAGSGLSAGPTILTGNALLAPLADNGGPMRTIALRPGSPALDAATVLGGLTTDQRGFPRNRDGNAIAGTLPDIGAYEAQVAPVSGLGFNFVGGGSGGPGGTLAAVDVAGVPEFAQANWTNLSGTIDGAPHDGTYAGNGPVPVVNASGAAFSPNLRLWWSAHHLWNISNAVQSTPDRRLMNGYLDSNVGGPGYAATNLYASFASQPFFAVAGVPSAPGGYKAIVYTDGDANDRVGEYWLTTNRAANPASVAGESDLTPHVFVQDNANFSNTFTRVPATSTSNLGTSTPAGNYVVFEGLTEPGFIVRAEEAVTSSPINAVQIVRNEIIVVTTAADELDANGTPGAGVSLREALRDAPSGGGILFDSTLNGATLTLDSAKGELVLNKDVTIDASNLSSGVTLNGGPGANRILTIGAGKSATLLGLTLTGGNGTGALATGDGGAILNRGHLRLTGCTLSANTATGSGGALANEGTALLTRSTVAGNTASGAGGGGISNTGATAVVTLTHCTVSTNQAPTGAGGGLSNVDGTTTLAFSIVAGNTASSAANVSGAFAQTGASLTSGNPQLGALTSNGGPTQTMALLAGSPALNAAVGSLATSDQRGSPIVGVPDLGAYESGAAATTTYSAWSVQVAGSVLPATDDTERDGAINVLEYALRRNPQVSDTPLSPTLVKQGAGRQFAFRYQATAGDLRYIVERNPNLTNAGSWTEIYRLDTSTGIITEDPSITGDENATTQVITLLDPAAGPRLFWRLRIELLP